jgi:hypothetical protein
MTKILKKMIAPCGMNCALCMGYQREKDRCMGCRSNGNKPQYCMKCIIANCEQVLNNKSKLCYECDKFPCPRLKRLDKRYRNKYHMSMLDNLNNIKDNGIEFFLDEQVKKWTCPNCHELLSVHRNFCLHCKEPYIIDDKEKIS